MYIINYKINLKKINIKQIYHHIPVKNYTLYFLQNSFTIVDIFSLNLNKLLKIFLLHVHSKHNI